MYKLFLILTFWANVFAINATESYKSKKDKVSMTLSENGLLREVIFDMGNGKKDTVGFRQDQYAGPSFGKEVVMKRVNGRKLHYQGEKDGISYSVSYSIGFRYVDVHVAVENTTKTVFSPEKLPFYLGVDTYMDSFPKWNNQYFPTFFRCEKNNFWGYMMSPSGKILSISSPDPIGSYSYQYLNEMYGHYIYTVSLDLLCQAPLPQHHPEMNKIQSGEKKEWSIRISPVCGLNSVKSHVAQYSKASFIELNTHSASVNDEIKISVIGTPAEVKILAPTGEKYNLGTVLQGNEKVFSNTGCYGIYWIEAKNADGQISTANFYVHPSWGWYLKRAREQSLVYVPRANKINDCCETWYSLLGFYLAEKHYPDMSTKNVADKLLNRVLDSLFVDENGLMHTVTYKERIQNVSAMVSILSLKYSCDKDIKTLQTGAKCVDFLLSRQHETGYYGGYGMAHYTSVLYIAKSILEFMDQIKPLTASESVWKERYDRYAKSVSRAIEELSIRGRDIKTEGQATFEDGAVSCSASQLLNYSLRIEGDTLRKERYKKAGLTYLQDHSCLTRLIDPDGRTRGATSRFWECWGDIRTPMQVMLSPHGWSGWRLYASYYAYLATGEYYRLQQLMDALGACTQLIEYPSGDLRYVFAIDPHFQGGELRPDKKTKEAHFYPSVMSSGYLKLIGSWFGQNTEGTNYLDKTNWDWEGAGTAYEIFKAMEEIAAINAFVCEHNNDYAAYNCKVKKESKNAIIINLIDPAVTRIHLNIQNNCKVTVIRNGENVMSASFSKGMQWIKVN